MGLTAAGGCWGGLRRVRLGETVVNPLAYNAHGPVAEQATFICRFQRHGRNVIKLHKST